MPPEPSDVDRRHDPREGVDGDGMIVTGAARSAVPALFEPLLKDVIGAMPAEVELYIYGSVATGQATPKRSDVDLLTVGLPHSEVVELSLRLSSRYSGVCRAVEISAAQPNDFVGADDAAYGMRVFLRHYCVDLAGPSRPLGSPFLADAHAARGFNGDIAQHVERWMQQLDDREPNDLAQAVARKTLLAVAGLVSMHDATWTTDRRTAAARWGEIEPSSAEAMSLLTEWSQARPAVTSAHVRSMLESTVNDVVDRFDQRIGLWVVS